MPRSPGANPLPTVEQPRRCVEVGCDEPAGTRWTPYWCLRHDEERRDRISRNLDAMTEQEEASRG